MGGAIDTIILLLRYTTSCPRHKSKWVTDWPLTTDYLPMPDFRTMHTAHTVRRTDATDTDAIEGHYYVLYSVRGLWWYGDWCLRYRPGNGWSEGYRIITNTINWHACPIIITELGSTSICGDCGVFTYLFYFYFFLNLEDIKYHWYSWVCICTPCAVWSGKKDIN